MDKEKSPPPEQAAAAALPAPHAEPTLPEDLVKAEKAFAELSAHGLKSLTARPIPPLQEEVLGVFLMLLGQRQTDWRSAKQILVHQKQISLAMHTLGLMVATNDAPAANFKDADVIIKKWLADCSDYGLLKKLQDSVKKSEADAKAAPGCIASWCLEIHRYWEAQQNA